MSKNEVTYKVSASGKPFNLYRSDINDSMPDDATVITKSNYDYAVKISANNYEGGVFSYVNVIEQSWNEIREERDRLINSVSFEYEKNAREKRLLRPVSRSDEWMTNLDIYIQALADIPQNFNNPKDVVWPTLPNN